MSNKDNKIKIFGSDDDLKALGELLSNETSRKIISSLMKKEMYTNELATTLDMRVSLIIHHLKKMEELGLLEITNKKIIRKGQEHRFFRMSSDIFITLNNTKEEINKKELLKRIFRDGIKFASIGISGMFIWMSDIPHFLETQSPVFPVPFGLDNSSSDPLVPALIIVIVGLIIERVFSIRKNKKRGLAVVV